MACQLCCSHEGRCFSGIVLSLQQWTAYFVMPLPQSAIPCAHCGFLPSRGSANKATLYEFPRHIISSALISTSFISTCFHDVIQRIVWQKSKRPSRTNKSRVESGPKIGDKRGRTSLPLSLSIEQSVHRLRPSIS